MGRTLSAAEATLLQGCSGELEAAQALGVPVERVRRAVVHLLWDTCSVPEALTAAATLASGGDDDEARAVVQAVLDQCSGLGGVPLGGQRRAGEPLG